MHLANQQGLHLDLNLAHRIPHKPTLSHRHKSTPHYRSWMDTQLSDALGHLLFDRGPLQERHGWRDVDGCRLRGNFCCSHNRREPLSHDDQGQPLSARARARAREWGRFGGRGEGLGLSRVVYEYGEGYIKRHRLLPHHSWQQQP